MADKKPVKTPVKHDYDVLADCWIAGGHRKKGDTISLTEGAAKYELLSEKIKAVAKPSRSKKTSAAAKG